MHVAGDEHGRREPSIGVEPGGEQSVNRAVDERPCHEGHAETLQSPAQEWSGGARARHGHHDGHVGGHDDDREPEITNPDNGIETRRRPRRLIDVMHHDRRNRDGARGIEATKPWRGLKGCQRRPSIQEATFAI